MHPDNQSDNPLFIVAVRVVVGLALGVAVIVEVQLPVGVEVDVADVVRVQVWVGVGVGVTVGVAVRDMVWVPVAVGVRVAVAVALAVQVLAGAEGGTPQTGRNWPMPRKCGYELKPKHQRLGGACMEIQSFTRPSLKRCQGWVVVSYHDYASIKQETSKSGNNMPGV